MKKQAHPPTAINAWHYCSGITLSLFIGIHLANQAAAVAGAAEHVAWMTVLRKVYRYPVVEGVLLLAVLSQIVSGLLLVFRKRAPAAERLQQWSGLYLAFFLVVHVGAVMYGRSAGIDTNFYFAAGGLADGRLALFFIPYYFLAVAAVFLHVAAIHYRSTGGHRSAYVIGLAGLLVAGWLVFTLRAAFINDVEEKRNRQAVRSGMPVSLSGLRTRYRAEMRSSVMPKSITVSTFPVPAV